MELKNVHIVKSKGRLYAYHRPTKTRLTEEIGSPEFVKRVNELNEQMARPKAVAGDPGTIQDLVTRYKESTAFTELSKAAQKDYRRYLDIVTTGRCGRLHGEAITNAFMLDLRDKFAKTPRKANALIMVFRRVLGVSVQREWIRHCPALAQKQEKLKEGPGYKPWPEQALQRFRDSAPEELVRAMELALHTGQRQSDLLTMTWHQIQDGEITLTQKKPGVAAEEMVIPVSAALAVVLAGIKKKSINVLTRKNGKPWKKYTFRHKFGEAVRDAGLEGLVYHGLRHTAATRLAEQGLSDRVIASITGHKSTDSIKRYTRRAAQKKLARIAVKKVESK